MIVDIICGVLWSLATFFWFAAGHHVIGALALVVALLYLLPVLLIAIPDAPRPSGPRPEQEELEAIIQAAAGRA